MTASERDAVRSEYAELFGQGTLDLVLRCRKSISWMRAECGNERVSRARCKDIREQLVVPNPNLRTY